MIAAISPFLLAFLYLHSEAVSERQEREYGTDWLTTTTHAVTT